MAISSEYEAASEIRDAVMDLEKTVDKALASIAGHLAALVLNLNSMRDTLREINERQRFNR